MGLGDISPQASVAIGILVGLLSTSIQSLGLTLQRKSHLIEDAKDAVETRRPPYKRRKWQLGMFMFVTSNIIGSTIQITTLPLPVLSTLQASGLVFNTAFATLLLKEPFSRYSIIGTILTCGGAALIAVFGSIGEPAHNLEQLLELFNQRDFIIWMVGTMVVAIGTVLLAHILKIWSSHEQLIKRMSKIERPSSAGGLHQTAGANHLRRSFTAQLPQPLQVRVSRLRFLRGMSYALVSGILSAHSLLMAKSAVELVVRTIVDHNNQFNRFQSWLIVIALLFFALSQLYYLHLGLRLCSTSVLYPLVFCIYNIIAILDGLIYFQQASRLTALHAGLVAVGTVVLLAGVLALSWRLDDTPSSEPPRESIAPQTPLVPGMGLLRTSDDESSPLLPTGRARSATATSRRSLDETTPLIGRRTRALTLPGRPSTPEPGTGDIWAELEDEGNDEEYIASLPRAPSPFLTHRGSRPWRLNRGDSMSSQALSSTSAASKRGSRSVSQSPGGGPRKAHEINPRELRSAIRRSSAPQSKLETDGSQPRVRSHTTSVRFAETTKHDQRPSRWDQAAQRKPGAKKDAEAKNVRKGDSGDPGG